jgi:hypothetical protein
MGGAWDNPEKGSMARRFLCASFLIPWSSRFFFKELGTD